MKLARSVPGEAATGPWLMAMLPGYCRSGTDCLTIWPHPKPWVELFAGARQRSALHRP